MKHKKTGIVVRVQRSYEKDEAEVIFYGPSFIVKDIRIKDPELIRYIGRSVDTSEFSNGLRDLIMTKLNEAAPELLKSIQTMKDLGKRISDARDKFDYPGDVTISESRRYSHTDEPMKFVVEASPYDEGDRERCDYCASVSIGIEDDVDAKFRELGEELIKQHEIAMEDFTQRCMRDITEIKEIIKNGN